MRIFDYCSSGGKNLITTYIDSLPDRQKLEIYECELCKFFTPIQLKNTK